MKVPSHDVIDQTHAATVSRLLEEPTPEAIRVYYSSLLEAQNCSGLEVKYIGSDIGKGVFATQNFEIDDLVLKERMLVGAQHTQNKADALVCSFCFCFIGSIELQIGRRLLSSLPEGSENTSAVDQASEGSDTDYEDTAAISGAGFCCHDLDNMNHMEKNVGSCTKLPLGVAEELVNGSLRLPFSDLFPLPSIVTCVGGCEDELFCSETCAKAAWDSYHSLLCTGPDSLCKEKDLLREFIKHANETNDIFLVAAKVISSTILRASRLKQLRHARHPEITQPSNDAMSVLLEAWEPFFMGFKRLWWDSVALPTDLGPNDEMEFRNQLKELSSHSLKLLKGAIFQEEYAALFSLQVYGHIISMFELNNLDLVVASPVEDYFIYVDELPVEQKMEAEKTTRPLLDALGDEYNIPCQGTAFFPLQSCFNHSCFPNSKAFKRDEDKDGQAVLLTTRPIQIGEELHLQLITHLILGYNLIY
eukprot:c22840_g1_i1 orf=623-2047(-)